MAVPLFTSPRVSCNTSCIQPTVSAPSIKATRPTNTTITIHTTRTAANTGKEVSSSPEAAVVAAAEVRPAPAIPTNITTPGPRLRLRPSGCSRATSSAPSPAASPCSARPPSTR